MKKAACQRCGSPRRQLRTFADLPDLTPCRRASWMELRRCPACGQLWVVIVHEPFASFEVMTAWPADEQAFVRLARRHGGRIVHEWHNAVVRERWRALPQSERAAVAAWLRRLADGTDLDGVPGSGVPGGGEARFVARSEDLQGFLDAEER